MDIPSEIIFVVIVIHGLIFLFIFLFLLVYNPRSSLFRREPLAKAKSLAEQRLLLEAISACAGEPNLPSLLKSIGKHAAETAGFANWLIWMARDDGSFRVAEAAIEGCDMLLDELQSSHDPRLYSWVRRNASPIQMGSHAVGMVESEAMKAALGRLGDGVLIPFIDSETIQGFAVVGGRRLTVERRSRQYLDLFGAFAAIIIKKSILDRRERMLRLEQQRTENLAGLGRLAAGLAHEIRNPLTFIKSATQHLSDYYNYQTEDTELSKVVLEEINRINQHIEELLLLGRIDPKQFGPVNLGQVIFQTVKLARSAAVESGVEMSVSLEENGIMIARGNADLLRQLLSNLIINGIQAMGDGGKLCIRLRRQCDRFRLEVEDTGRGIDPAIADRIFDPFFTTKEKGTGLGLSIAHSVARAHGGGLELVRSDASGTCFGLVLPSAAPPAHRRE